MFFVVNGIERMLIEQIRINTPYPNLLNLTQAELVAGAFVLLGLIIIAVSLRTHKAKGGGPAWGPA
jgi:prolipoprotein diacylglyceryltransferase